MMVVLGVVLVFVQILLGGLVASTYSGMVCVDFPTCNGQYFPELKGPIGIQMVHRFGAYLLACLVTALFVLSLFYSKKIGLKHFQRVMATKVFLLLFSQIFIGVMNLKYMMPAFLSVIHLSIALIILLKMTELFLSLISPFQTKKPHDCKIDCSCLTFMSFCTHRVWIFRSSHKGKTGCFKHE